MSESKYPWKVRVKTWFYYYKWWALAAIIILISLIPVFKSLLGIGVVHPDYQIAVVTAGGISQEAEDELKAALERLGQDCNGDGRVVVSVVQYRTGAGDQETMMGFQQAANIQIQGDLSQNGSHFFLMEDPAWFQRAFQVLSDGDGKLPDDADFSAEGRYVSAGNLSVPLGEELSRLYLGQRGYYNEEKIQYLSEYRGLWQALTVLED